MEDVAKVDKSVASHGEGELGLAGAGAFDGSDEEGAGVEDRCDGGEPGLVVVLRTVVAEDGIGDVGFKHLGRPALPLCKEFYKGLFTANEAVAEEKFARGGRRTGASVEQSYGYFATREGAVKERDVADDKSHKAQAYACLDDNESAGEVVGRRDVAKTQRKERGAADVEAIAQSCQRG